MAHVETHIGRYEDKVLKNRLVTTKAPGPEDLEVQAVSGDAGMMVIEWAPFGVVGAITPVTNPTSTIINNTISIVSAGNAVVFNAHPSAQGLLRGDDPAHQPGHRGRRRPRRPGDRRGPAHHRHGTGAHDPPRSARAAGDRRPGRGARGAAHGQARHHRRPGQPTGRRGPDGGCRASGPRHRARRVLRQQPRLHRREGRAGRGLRGRPAPAGHEPARRLPAQGARAAPAGARHLQGARGHRASRAS